MPKQLKTVKNHAKIAENYEKPCENTSEPLKTRPGTLESAESRKYTNSTLADAIRTTRRPGDVKGRCTHILRPHFTYRFFLGGAVSSSSTGRGVVAAGCTTSILPVLYFGAV